MENHTGRNAVAALLAEYKKAMRELQNLIQDLNEMELVKIVDHQTSNLDCKSIQTILTHVVCSGYSYCVYILNLKDPGIQRPARILRYSALEYKNDLDDVLKFTEDTFSTIKDDELEEFNNAKKIKTLWGQVYDIEQIMEHAIVHILRHRFQIEKFKVLVRSS